MYENTKAAFLRRSHNRVFTNVFKGNGLHVSPGSDPLKKNHYPLCENIEMLSLKSQNLETDGSKEALEGKLFDFIYLTNLQEYENEPLEVINHYLNYVEPKGHLVITAPDEDLYEQGNFPSIFNNGHKRTFSIYKQNSWSGKHYNFLDIIEKIDTASCRKIELVDTNFDYALLGKGIDQTVNFTDGVEAIIEVILKKY